MSVYYNDSDAFICQWVRNLIAAGLVPDGEVDERPIQEVEAADVKEFVQAHFFCGILGWPLALRLAGWPAERPVWTGSCPCQPFSCAGKRKGERDKRHLWPEFRRLIAECLPRTCFGEQVAGKAGREWLAGVRVDLEALGYAVGAADLPAACVGAPHIRQRLWWVADAGGPELRRRAESQGQHGRVLHAPDGGADGGMADGSAARRGGNEDARAGCCDARAGPRCGEPERDRHAGGLADAAGCLRASGGAQAGQRQAEGPSAASAWDGAVWLPCADGKARRVEPSIPVLAHGVPGRVGRIRAYGNAIVSPLAAEFVRAFLEAEGDLMP